MPQRYDLDAAERESRRPIDAEWSKQKKTAVVGACVVGASLALGAGWWAMSAIANPGLPTNASDALAVMASSKFESMDEMRKRQYAAEARRLLSELPAEDRRALFEDENAREAMREMREETMDEIARRVARGESIEGMFPGGPRGPRPEGERRERPADAPAFDPEQFRQQMDQRLAEQIQSGNAQSGGLRGEMFKRGMRGGGGGGRGGGGGGRGPRGG